MIDYQKPLPELTSENEGFWQGTNSGELRLQECSDCSHIRYPISFTCPRCLSERSTWKKLSGRGEVFSFIVFHQVYDQRFAADVPYNVALIQLEEGPRMISNVVGTPNASVKVGDKVAVTFDRVTDKIAIPRFTPLSKGSHPTTSKL